MDSVGFGEAFFGGLLLFGIAAMVVLWIADRGRNKPVDASSRPDSSKRTSPKSDPPAPPKLTHAQRETEAQNAARSAQSLTLPELRIARARLADMLETDLPPTARERLVIRGEIIHQLVNALEAGLVRPGEKLARSMRRLGGGADAAFFDLLRVPEIPHTNRW